MIKINKTGIITFHNSYNCGSMLQAYALQHKLDELGVDNEIIDFANDGSRRLYSRNVPLCRKHIPRPRLMGPWLRAHLYNNLWKRHQEDFVHFKEKYLRTTAKEYTCNKQLIEEVFPYTHFVTGSDQVWNVCCWDADEAYFLNFVNNGKKIAYAVSLGAQSIVEKVDDVEKYKRYIKAFDYISVREQIAKKLITELREKEDVSIQIDPTLLYFKEDYERFFDLETPIVKGDYIFYYAFSYFDEVNKYVNEISKRTGMPVYIMDAKAWAVSNVKKEGYKLSPNSGPLAFLNLMKHSKLSLTTSFHGTAFSVIFEKPFWYIDNSKHDAADDRATSLMNQLGIIDHFKKGYDILQGDVMASLDYSVINKSRIQLRTSAIEFLIKCFE